MADDDGIVGGPAREVPPETPAETEPAAATTAPAPVLKTRWRDRAWSFRALLAVALATLIIGGIVGGLLGAAATHHHDRRDGFYYRMGGGPGMPPGWRMHRGNGWRWQQQPQQPQPPYGGTTPSAPSSPAPSSPSATG